MCACALVVIALLSLRQFKLLPQRKEMKLPIKFQFSIYPEAGLRKASNRFNRLQCLSAFRSMTQGARKCTFK